MSTQVVATPLNAIKGNRIESIDFLRGIIMILMVLDHVRDYFHINAFLYSPTDLSQTSAPLFLTRWVTHFCAPIFIFLSGASAYLSGLKKTRRELSFFLFSRGISLIVLELTVINFAWTFYPFFHIIILQVIWVIAISMMVLSILIFLPLRWILYLGLLMIFTHNLLDAVPMPDLLPGRLVLSILHKQNMLGIGDRKLLIVYPLIPWIGVMAVGYCLGSLYRPGFDPLLRKKWLIRMGWGAISFFILLRLTNLYGDPSPWSTQKNALFSFLSFINTTKYPSSLLYNLMTLGPALLFLAYAEKPVNTGIVRRISVFGRVPLFFYILHIYLVHLLAMLGAVATGFKWSDMVLRNFFISTPQLKGYGFDIVIVYMVWILIVLILFPLCKKFDRYKRNHASSWWLRYF
jgi:uncharacterized membrane protein